MSNNKVINSWDWDIRVRERNLRNGVLTEKDIEKQRAGLPDQGEHAELLGLPQPALAPEQPAPSSYAAAPAAVDRVAPPPVSQPTPTAPVFHEPLRSGAAVGEPPKSGVAKGETLRSSIGEPVAAPAAAVSPAPSVPAAVPAVVVAPAVPSEPVAAVSAPAAVEAPSALSNGAAVEADEEDEDSDPPSEES